MEDFANKLIGKISTGCSRSDMMIFVDILDSTHAHRIQVDQTASCFVDSRIAFILRSYNMVVTTAFFLSKLNIQVRQIGHMRYRLSRTQAGLMSALSTHKVKITDV